MPKPWPKRGESGALVAPSILSADFARMGAECEHVLGAGADLLHVDVMDGHFAPNLTMGPDMVRGLRSMVPEAFLDVHLMVTEPEKFVEPFAKAGADHLSFHVEVVAGAGAMELIDRIRGLGLGAGVAINPGTDPREHLEVIRAADLVVVMGVVPGFSGQKLIPESLRAAEVIRDEADALIEFDGGVTVENAAMVRESGVGVLVGGSSVFGRAREERASAIRGLRGGVDGA